MKNYWISWYSPKALGSWEMYNPWWISGYAMTQDEDVPIICAAVRAPSEDNAKAGIVARYDRAPAVAETVKSALSAFLIPPLGG